MKSSNFRLNIDKSSLTSNAAGHATVVEHTLGRGRFSLHSSVYTLPESQLHLQRRYEQ